LKVRLFGWAIARTGFHISLNFRFRQLPNAKGRALPRVFGNNLEAFFFFMCLLPSRLRAGQAIILFR
jgi:hypothetical protein